MGTSVDGAAGFRFSFAVAGCKWFSSLYRNSWYTVLNKSLFRTQHYTGPGARDPAAAFKRASGLLMSNIICASADLPGT